MADNTDPATRSRVMSRIRGYDTTPEKAVRSYLHRAGYRFRLHVKDLPGSPDIVLPKWKTVVFVHGCFWHRHLGCLKAYTPKSNVEFWTAKFQANVGRDIRKSRELKRLGWRVLVVWECQAAAGKLSQLASRIKGRDQTPRS